MEKLKKLSASIDRITEKTGDAVKWLLFLMILVAVYNAAARYLGRYAGASLTSNFFLELQWYLFSTVFLLGAAGVLKKDGHVRVDVFYSLFSREKKALVNLAGGILFCLPFAAFLLILSLPSVYNSWLIFEDSPDPGGIVRYPIKTLLPASLFLIFLQGVSEIIKAWAYLKSPRHSRDLYEHTPTDLPGG